MTVKTTKGSIKRQLNKYIFQSMLAMAGMSCYLMADTYFISVAGGANGITALNLTLPLYALLYSIGAMIGVGSATRFSLNKSLENEGYDLYFGNAIFWTLGISIIFEVAGFIAPDGIMKFMGADDIILSAGLPYFRTVFLFAPAFMLNMVITAFVRNDNDPRLAMIAMLISNFSNIILDYIFMFPMKMGVLGAAVATGISPIICMCVCTMHFVSKNNTLCIVKKMPSLRRLFYSCSVGVAAFVGEISSGVIAFSFNYVLLGLVGNIGVAAYGVVANISLVAIALFNGVAQGLQPMASVASGKARYDEQRVISRHSLIIGVVAAAVMLAICCLFTSPIVDVFNSEKSKELAMYAVPGLRLYSIGFILASINIVRAGYFGAVGKAFECSVISVIRGIFAIVLFVLLLPKFMGIYGVWLAFPMAELFTLAVSVVISKVSQKP